jgi:hypothetical protein
MASLIERINERIGHPARVTDGADVIEPTIAAPPRDSEVDAAEAALGFRIPPLLRRLYLEVGNGGFGPGYGLIGVPTEETAARRQQLVETYYRNIQRPRDDPRWWPAELVPVEDFDIVGLYARYAREDPEDPGWRWPERLLPVCHLGCGMYECVDCSDQRGAVIWFEPNPRERGEPLTDFLIPLAPSMEYRWQAWLADEDLMDDAYDRSALKRHLDG